MAQVTNKLQVTLPKALAQQYGIGPGDEIQWMAVGDVMRVIPPGKTPARLDAEARLRLFDKATLRQRTRDGKCRVGGGGHVEPQVAAGHATSCTTIVADLVDTNVLETGKTMPASNGTTVP